jgi:hypothetical protein
MNAGAAPTPTNTVAMAFADRLIRAGQQALQALSL